MIGIVTRRALAPLVLLLPTLGGCASSPSADAGNAGRAGAVAIGAPLPRLVVNDLRSGAAVSLPSLQGKVVLLDIWASWCAPCREELPMLDDMAMRLESKGVAIVAVSIDEEKAQAIDFLKSRERWTLRVAHDPEGKLPSALEPPKMPTSYVIDRRGVLRAVNAGFERADAARIEAELTRLAGVD
jgi:thiol-disulfide isomerase/thioredoxin